MKVLCRYDEICSVDLLKPYPKNRNTHTKDQIERLAKLLRYQGVRAPVIVANPPYNCIAKGHGTLDAIKLNGWKEAPIVYQDFENEDQLYAFVQSDNAISTWSELDLSNIRLDIGDLGLDFDVDLLGIKDFEIESENKFNTDPDDIPIVDEPSTSLGDLYELSNHRLLCGDSTKKEDFDRLMNGEKADMVFTDPPYGLGGYGGRNHMELLGDDKDPTPFYQCIPSARERYVWGYFWTLPMLNFTPKDAIVWKKNNFGLGRGYRGQYEVCFYYGEFNESDSDVWEESKDVHYQHPTQKPVALAERAIRNSKPANVLDLFLGSGSTLIACEKMNQRCYGMEISPHYCDVIVARWESFTGKKAVKTAPLK